MGPLRVPLPGGFYIIRRGVRTRRSIAFWVAVGIGLLASRAIGAADCPSLYDCALAEVGRRDFASAIRRLETEVAEGSRDLKAMNLLGIALTGAGRKAEGNRWFRQALSVDPAFSPAQKNLAINEYDAGRIEVARGHFEGVLERAPADEVAHLYLGEIHYGGGRRREALAHYEKSGGRFVQDPRSTLHFGRCLLEAGQTSEAVRVLEEIPAASGSTLFEAGVFLGRAGAHAEAARFFGASRATGDDAYAAGYNQTLMLVEAGDAEGALRVSRELFAGEAGGSLAPEGAADLRNLVSRAYLKAGRIQEAYDSLREAIRLDPRKDANYIDLASICVEHDNFDLGLEIVDIGLRQLPDSWRLYLQRGVLLAMKARMAEAEKEFESARRLAPAEPVPYAALGMAWMQSGQADKAVGVLRAELARHTDHVVPYIFAVALLRSGTDPTASGAKEAVEALRASIRAHPGFAPARAELGRLLFKQDALGPAIVELEKAAALDPAGTPALYVLSQAYRRNGEPAKAQALLARVSRLNAQERGDDQDGEFRRAVFRIVREGTARPTMPPPEP